jgi:hypothetical protein
LVEGDKRREILLDAGEHQLVVSASGYAWTTATSRGSR